MDRSPRHRGVAADDPRNAGAIEHFRPKTPTRSSIAATLAPYYATKGAVELERKVEAVMDRIERGPVRPDPPLSQSLETVADPWFGLGTRPDIIEILWALDDTLPERCRWVFWGGPALVHPGSGVVFAVGMGTIGIVMRLPAQVLAAADPDLASAAIRGNPGQTFEIGPAGPEWRFIGAKAPRTTWVRAAYDFAG
jgi:hypothetical protein